MFTSVNQQPEKLKLTFSRGGTLTATLLWDKAPKTCEAMVETLKNGPVKSDDYGPLLHAQYAGSEVYFENFPARDNIPFENTTMRIDENMFCTNKIPGGVLAYYVNPKIKSFCIVYGELVPRRTVDVEIPLNIFATIDNWDDAKEIGSRARVDGPGSVTVEIL